MKSHASLTEEVGTLGALLKTPFDAILDYIYGRLSGAGFDDVRPAHSAVFRNLARDGSRVTELAERARMSKQSMAELIEHLRKRHYVELVPDPSDGRAKLVRFTGRGLRIHATLVRISREFEQECARRLGEKRWRSFRASLQEFADLSRQLAGS